MAKSVKLQDIAERLGISIVAVSKALNGQKGVSEELREKIKRTAAEMGYAPPIRKKSSHSCTNVIGVLASSRFIDADSFYLKYYKHISSMLQQRNKYAFFHTLSVKDEENLEYPKLLEADKIDGMIILGQISKAYTELIEQRNIHAVFLDFYDDRKNIDCVICDGFYASYDMTNYLISMGHRKLAFVGSVNATSSIQDRYLGYVKSLMEHHIHVSSNYVLDDRDENGLLKPIQLPVDMPTAFVCNCDGTACMLIKQLKKEGFRVPEDISVTGFDNSVYSEVSEPKITTIEVNTEKMSLTAVDAILKKIENPSYSIGRISISGDIIYKNSVRSVI